MSETTFQIPGTGAKVPKKFLLIAGGIGAVVLLLFRNRQPAEAGEEGEFNQEGDLGEAEGSAGLGGSTDASLADILAALSNQGVGALYQPAPAPAPAYTLGSGFDSSLISDPSVEGLTEETIVPAHQAALLREDESPALMDRTPYEQAKIDQAIADAKATVADRERLAASSERADLRAAGAAARMPGGTPARPTISGRAGAGVVIGPARIQFPTAQEYARISGRAGVGPTKSKTVIRNTRTEPGRRAVVSRTPPPKSSPAVRRV